MRRFLLASLVLCVLGGAHSTQAVVHQLGEDAPGRKIRAQMAPEWRACSIAEDCETIMYGCSGFIAANKRYVAEATRLAHDVGGDPAEIECAADAQPLYAATSCVQSVCLATDLKE